MELAFVPLYIKYLGIEAYGLIGIFALLQAWLTLLDMGMTPTLSREMARFTGGSRDAQSLRDLLRSIEIIAIGVALVFALGTWWASDWLASDWLRANKLPVEEVAQAFSIMGVVAAFRFIENVYHSCIVGLQRQVLLNVVIGMMATLKGLGAVGILVWVSPTIQAFFLWQGVISIITAVSFATVIYRIMPVAANSGRFSKKALQEVWRFAGGMLGITFLSMLLMLSDKVLLSKLLTLEEYGYYALAVVAAGGLMLVVSPISQAFYPRFVELLARGDEVDLAATYHKGAQLVTVLMGSATIILVVFGEVVLKIWTHDADLAHKVAPLVAVLALGNFLNGLMWMPYQMQLAYGWTSFAVKVNIIAVAVIVPAVIWVTPEYGAIGAAWIWVGLNAGYATISVHFVFKKILIGEKWRWYLQDVLIPISAAIAVCAVFKLVEWNGISVFTQVVLILFVSVVLCIASALASSEIRGQVMILFSNFILRRSPAK